MKSKILSLVISVVCVLGAMLSAGCAPLSPLVMKRYKEAAAMDYRVSNEILVPLVVDKKRFGDCADLSLWVAYRLILDGFDRNRIEIAYGTLNVRHTPITTADHCWLEITNKDGRVVIVDPANEFIDYSDNHGAREDGKYIRHYSLRLEVMLKGIVDRCVEFTRKNKKERKR